MKFQSISLIILLLIFLSSVRADDNECGVYALERVLNLSGVPVNYSELKENLQVTKEKGTSFLQIDQVAKELGLKTNPVRITAEDLLKVKQPAIAFVRGDHFVTVAAVDPIEKSLFILDQNREPEWVSITEFEKIWNGEVITLESARSIQGPSFWVPSYLLDFGTMYGVSGEMRSITILNVGDEPLVLKKAQFSCSCTEIEELPIEIPPHSARKIDLVVDTSAKPNGDFSLRMYLTTNEGLEEPRGFELKGNVFKRALLQPSYFTLGDIEPDDKQREFTSYLVLGSDYQGDVRPREGDNGLHWVSGKRISGQEDIFEIKTVLNFSEVNADREGRFFCNLMIETDHEQYEYIELGATGTRLPMLEALPRSVFIASTSPKDATKKKVHIVSRSSEPPVITVSDPKTLSVTLVDNQLNIQVTTPSEKGLFTESITVSVGKTSIEIPVRGIIN